MGPIAQLLILGAMITGLCGCFLDLVRSGNIVIGDLFDGFSMFWKGLFVYFITTLIISSAAITGGLILGSVYFMDVPVPEEHPLFFIGILIAAVSAVVFGIYMSLRYALVYFVVNDDPEINVFEVLKTSQRRMEGHKKKLFGLFLSYVPWFFLGMLTFGIVMLTFGIGMLTFGIGMLTFGIGMLWAGAYMMAGFAAFYEDLGEAA